MFRVDPPRSWQAKRVGNEWREGENKTKVEISRGWRATTTHRTGGGVSKTRVAGMGTVGQVHGPATQVEDK